MAAHRYWRLLFRANNTTASNFVGVREVELRTAIGGADVTGSGTASASTTFGGLSAASAFDNGTAEWATSGAAFTQWLKYDFGAGNDKDIVEVAITSRNAAGQQPTDFDLQYSDDDSSWTTLYSIQDSNWGLITTNVYNASSHPTLGNATSKTFWRVNATAADGSATTISIAELEMFLATDGSGADLCTGGRAFASTTFNESPVPQASRAVDDSGSTYWSSVSPTSGWMGYLFAVARDVKAIAITARLNTGSTQQNQTPKNFTIQYWDGAAFQTFATLTNITGWTSGQKRYFAASGEISAPNTSGQRPQVFINC